MIKQLFQAGIVQQRKLRKRASESLKARLGRMLAPGDHAVLALGLQEAAQEILTDDEGLGKVAVAIGFQVTASADLLVDALKQGELDWASFDTAIRGLVLENRLSARLAELYLMEGARYAQR